MRRFLISGSTGLIGRRLAEVRREVGDEVVPVLRSASGDGVHPLRDGSLEPASVSGFDAVVHLAGEPVASGRWTAATKRAIRGSRVEGTRQLVAALRAAPSPPEVLICASGINFYGDHGSVLVDENTPKGRGFLADVCEEWEAEARALEDVSRVVSLRIGVVLTPHGGALKLMLPLFRMGLAGPIAGGRAYISWVTLDDVVEAVDHVFRSKRLTGAVNLVSPTPVSGQEFTTEVAAAVGRPALLPVPGWAARLMMGQLAEETVLTSIRALPRKLEYDAFVFRHPHLGAALAGWNLRR